MSLLSIKIPACAGKTGVGDSVSVVINLPLDLVTKIVKYRVKENIEKPSKKKA